MMRGKCHIATDLHRSNECHLTVGMAHGVNLRLVRGVAWIAMALVKGHLVHTWIPYSNEAAAHHL